MVIRAPRLLGTSEYAGDQRFVFCFLNFCSRQLKFYFFSSSEEALPVMVWFHGGGYTSGDSSSRLYGPEYLLDKDVILVTSNYRLGIFGFLTLGKVLHIFKIFFFCNFDVLIYLVRSSTSPT